MRPLKPSNSRRYNGPKTWVEGLIVVEVIDATLERENSPNFKLLTQDIENLIVAQKKRLSKPCKCPYCTENRKNGFLK